MADPRRTRLQEQRNQILADLRDLEIQVAAGEIDTDAAARLKNRYEVAAVDVMNALDTLGAPQLVGRSNTRVLVSVGVSLVAVVVVTVTLLKAIEPRPEGGFVTGGVAADVIEGAPVDLSSITNEEMETIVAANPDVFPMRLALARRYVEAGEFDTALPHYMYVLERETNAEALSYVGWMTYVSGDAVTAVALLERSLDVVPDDPLAQWFLANTLFYGTGDTAGAIPLLEALLESGIAPDDVAVEAQRMLSDATP